MRNIPTLFLSTLLFIGFLSCDKKGMTEPAGGELPTNYIIVKDSTFTPGVLRVVSRSSITFVNNTTLPHTITTDDSTTIKPISIVPGTSYFFKKDTSGTFPYHCAIHPSARGVIIITP